MVRRRKGYETLVDSDTRVDVNTGMIAAGRLQALIESRASGTSMADIWVKMDKIINAIQSTVPEELWPEILRKLDGDHETQSGGIDEGGHLRCPPHVSINYPARIAGQRPGPLTGPQSAP